MESYDLQPVQLGTGTEDKDGRLIFANGELIAIMVLLSDPVHGDQRGLWNIEAAFRDPISSSPLFTSPHEAAQWVLRRHTPVLVG